MIVHGGCQVSWTAARSGADSWDGRSWWPCGRTTASTTTTTSCTLSFSSLPTPGQVGKGRGGDRVAVCCEIWEGTLGVIRGIGSKGFGCMYEMKEMKIVSETGLNHSG